MEWRRAATLTRVVFAQYNSTPNPQYPSQWWQVTAASNKQLTASLTASSTSGSKGDTKKMIVSHHWTVSTVTMRKDETNIDPRIVTGLSQILIRPYVHLVIHLVKSWRCSTYALEWMEMKKGSKLGIFSSGGLNESWSSRQDDHEWYRHSWYSNRIIRLPLLKTLRS